MEQESNKKIHLKIPFTSTRYALLVYEVLSVDEEVKRCETQKTISTDDVHLLVNFEGKDLKKLRVAVNAFLKNVSLILKTVCQFDNLTK